MLHRSSQIAASTSITDTSLLTPFDVKSRFEVLTPGPSGWSRAPLAGVPEVGSADVLDTSPDDDDEYLLSASGYTQPATLYRGEIGGSLEPAVLRPIDPGANPLQVSDAEKQEAVRKFLEG